ncbi:phospholipase D-like domain-containing protein (plasmid) [Rhizobium phaseoli]|uniref:phospholipase D-like domain-containing protein n=1 Tax=Rhizobium phaseoli TaxID=396 RepID=UPI0007EB221F|nr:phospholipase D-like domain-containing protein [Rhizobium phaseoli]ANM08335.1 phospholipase D-like domain-containing protein [Rhizobium phaseoli]
MTGKQTIGAGLGGSLVQALGSDCAAASALAAYFEAGIHSLARGVSLDGLNAAAIDRAAGDFVRRGWIAADATGWRCTPAGFPAGLAEFLAGAAAMRASVLSKAQTEAVVTLPIAPSAIARVLPAEGPIHASLVRTDEAIRRIAGTALRSLTIMSPFVNREGIELAMTLFQETAANQRTLITRRTGSTKRALDAMLPEISARGVTVLDYCLRADEGYETFHAKVVIADGDLAYVGSANMTLYARHSMELGIIVQGKPARAVSALVRAVEKISHPVTPH